jgi:hypothetical protein
VPVATQMILVRWAGLVEIARIPIATFACGLRPEVNPDSELRVAQPRRLPRVMLLDGSPGRLEWPRRDGQIQFQLRKRTRIAQRHTIQRPRRRNFGEWRGAGSGSATGDHGEQRDDSLERRCLRLFYAWSPGLALPYTNRAARWPVHLQRHILRRSDTRIETLHLQ